MALIRWQPFRELETLRSQFDRLFEELVGGSAESEMTWMPPIELEDTEENLILRAQIPGIEAKDLDIQATRDSLYIGGEHRYEKQDEKKGYFRSEFRYGKFERTIPLPVEIVHDRVVADFKDGILTVTLPKVVEAQRRVVKISLGGDTSPSKSIGVGGETKYHATDQPQPGTVKTPEPAMRS